MAFTIPLGHGWSAILHQPLPGAGVLAVELLLKNSSMSPRTLRPW
jgi:hypothetical protein